LAQGFC